MTLSLFDDEPTAGEAAATATAATFDQPFDPRPEAARARLQAFLPQSGKRYASQRNFDFGPGKHQKVSALSPWLRHRIILETEVLEAVLGAQSAASAEKFIQEVFWRGYFKGWLEHRPEVWQRYRRRVTDLLGQLETDAALHARYEEAVGGHTGIACFDAWVQELVETNYLHNHARMWFASIWIFTLRLPWELGADFFFRHLLDGDAASNTCSWRWVGGLHTAGKTYLARAANIREYTAGRFDPEGQLAATAPPLDEPALGPRTPPAFADVDLAGQRVGLLITGEDCAAEGLEAEYPGLPKPVALAGWSAPVPRSLLPTAPAVEQFTAAAVEGAVQAAEARHGLEATRLGESPMPPDAEGTSAALADWAQAHQLDCIVTARLPIGPQRQAVHRAMRGVTTPLVELDRHYDRLVWPHARAGFFGLKKQIPGILRDLGLS